MPHGQVWATLRQTVFTSHWTTQTSLETSYYPSMNRNKTSQPLCTMVKTASKLSAGPIPEKHLCILDEIFPHPADNAPYQHISGFIISQQIPRMHFPGGDRNGKKLSHSLANRLNLILKLSTSIIFHEEEQRQVTASETFSRVCSHFPFSV